MDIQGGGGLSFLIRYCSLVPYVFVDGPFHSTNSAPPFGGGGGSATEQMLLAAYTLAYRKQGACKGVLDFLS